MLRLLLDRLSTADWLVVTAGLAVGIALLAIAAGRRVAAIDARAEHPAADATATNAEAEREVVHAEERGRPVEIERGGSPALAGARLVLASPYLLAIATTVGVYEIVSTVVDFQFTTTVHTTLDGPALGRHLARVYLLTNVASVAVQAFLTSLVMRRFGVGAALAVLPVALGLASVGFLFVPTLAFASLLSLADNSLAYSIAQSSKEMLYVPTTTAERYQAKAFIDVFVQRLAKVLAIGVSLALTTWTGADQVRWLGLLSIPLVGVSLLAVSRAGCDFRVREHEIEGPCPNPLAEVRRWIGRRVLRPATRRVGGLRTGDA
ncbi:MAG: Npt1/Npt2 family nucleotide transporter [Myxococcota bacterium]